jgi:hypothetical protein
MTQAAGRSHAKSRKCKTTQDMAKPLAENIGLELHRDQVDDRYNKK